MKLMPHLLLFILLIGAIQQQSIAGPPIELILGRVLQRPACTKTFVAAATELYPKCSFSPATDAALVQMAPLAIAAIAHLHDTPGFANRLHIVLQTLQLQTNGELYEIEKALQIIQSPHNRYACEKIEDMNPIIKLPQESTATYFDLRTQYRLIECKNLNWNDNPKEQSPGTVKLRSQFLRQQKTVFLLNQNYNTAYLYQVHSKRKVPGTWLEWFQKNGISVVEEKN